MTISSQVRTAGPFSCNGTTTVFPFAFKVFTASDVSVIFRDTASGAEVPLVLNIDYTVSLNANQNANPGGSISTIGPAFETGATLTLTSKLQYLQPTDLTNQGAFYPKVISDALDRLTIFAQQILGIANRALKFPISDGNLDGTLPGKDQRKGRVLVFHETTGLPIAGPSIGDVIPNDYIGEELPINPFSGMRWYKPSEATTFVYYVDGDSGQWVQEPVVSADSTLELQLAAADSTKLVGGVKAKELAAKSGGFVVLEQFSGTALQKLQAAYDSGATNIRATLPEYDFGAVTGNNAILRFTREVNIDFGGALLKVQGDNSGAFTSNTFITLQNTGGTFKNYKFVDENFTFAGPSRGVIPFLIYNSNQNSRGYVFENFEIIKGQSIITASSDNPLTARASHIRFIGKAVAQEVYYGINLANNGDDFEGSYVINDFFRAFFVYGTDGCKASYVANLGQPSSAAMLVSGTGSSAPKTQNYEINAVYKALNGAIKIAGQGASPDTSVYENIKISVNVASVGANKNTDELLTLGEGGLGDGTYSLSGLSLSYNGDVAFSSVIGVSQRSPNIDLVRINTNGSRQIGGLSNQIKRVTFGDGVIYTWLGSLSASSILIKYEDLAQGRQGPAILAAELRFALFNNFDFAGQRCVYARYLVTGYVTSGGVMATTSVTVLDRNDVGAGPFPSIALTGVSGGLQVSLDTFNDVFSSASITCLPLM